VTHTLQDQAAQLRKHPTLKGFFALIALAVMFAVAASSAQAANSIPLGTADSFSVLAGSAVTNTGPSVISGDVGVSPGTSVGGFPPAVTGGVIHSADGVAQGAQADLTIAYDDAAGQSSTGSANADPVGSTLTPGVYTASSQLALSGAVTLDGQGDQDAIFVFQAGSDLIVASGSSILLQNGAQACNVYWQVGTSATIGTGSTFVGNILALSSITMATGATLDGRALARNGAVTLDTNVITRSSCATSSGTPGGGTGTLPGPGGTTGSGATPGDNAAKKQAKQKRLKQKRLERKRRLKKARPPAFTG
jgi:hypothetical protein